MEAGYDVRQPDKENVTLLHWAAINNRIDLVKYVLDFKFKINYVLKNVDLNVFQFNVFNMSFFPWQYVRGLVH